jgi:hypothetical protein
MEPDLLEWFRVDRSRATRRFLWLGGGLVFTGAGLVGAAFLTHEARSALHVIALPGAAMIVSGLAMTISGLVSILARDEYLAVRADGLLFHGAEEDEVHAWPDIDRVAYDADAATWSVRRVDGTTRVVTVGYTASPRALAEHLEQLRSKAKLGELDEAFVRRVAIGLPHKTPD